MFAFAKKKESPLSRGMDHPTGSPNVPVVPGAELSSLLPKNGRMLGTCVANLKDLRDSGLT